MKKLPSKLRAVVAELSARPGVVGVFWGKGRSAGAWADEPVLCVHVRRKWDPPKAERILREYRGVRTDVLVVGDVRYHAVLDTADQVRGPSSTCSISGLARNDDDQILALVSGHGVLSEVAGGFAPGPWPPNSAPWVDFIDDRVRKYTLELLDGAVTSRMDFALGRLLDVTADDVLLGHQMAALPFARRSEPLAVGERLTHFSSERGRTVSGEVVHSQDVGALHDGVGIEIEQPIVVCPLAGETAFSIQGDSGSLVFDDDRRTVGFVVAGASNHVVSYLMPITAALRERMAQSYALFFEASA